MTNEEIPHGGQVPGRSLLLLSPADADPTVNAPQAPGELQHRRRPSDSMRICRMRFEELVKLTLWIGSSRSDPIG